MPVNVKFVFADWGLVLTRNRTRGRPRDVDNNDPHSLLNWVIIGSGSICRADYRQTSNISNILVGNKIVDHSDVVGVSPVGAAQTTSSFST